MFVTIGVPEHDSNESIVDSLAQPMQVDVLKVFEGNRRWQSFMESHVDMVRRGYQPVIFLKHME